MIDPASTVKAPDNPGVARAIVHALDDDSITLAVPGTEYRITLRPKHTVKASVGDTIHATIACEAMRMDVLKSGGRFLEPVEGRPRRVAGRIVAIDERNNTVTVNAGAPITVTPHKLQKATDFEIDQLVTMGIKDGATFEAVSV
ncbi:MAG: hypothetical protein ACYTF7_08745 [Planctomycetota bacterium]|jgi:hypothetical protein